MSNLFLNAEDRAAYEDLLGRFISLSDVERRKLDALVEKSRSAEKRRAGAIEKTVAQIAELDLQIEELFSRDQVARAAARLGIGARGKGATKESAAASGRRPHSPNVIIHGKPTFWAGRYNPEAFTPLFDAFKSGADLTAFFCTPTDKPRTARLVARLERELDRKATKAQLDALGLTRNDLKQAEAAYLATLKS